MRKAYKIIISLSVVLIAGLYFIVPAFAQDPFTSIAIGGLGGASGAGLFGSMAGMSGIDITYNSDPVNDAMWNSLNPDSVYFSGEKHEASGIDEDVWDYIDVDIGDWLSAQSDFIVNFAQTHSVTDDDSGNITTPKNYDGYPYNAIIGSVSVDSSSVGSTYLAGTTNLGISLTITQNGRGNYSYYKDGSSFYTRTNVSLPSNIWVMECKLIGDNSPTLAVHNQGQPYNETQSVIPNASFTPSTSLPWQSETVNLSVFDGWQSAKVKIPHSISQLQSGWSVPEFMSELDRIWSGAGEDNIIIEEGGDVPPVPPVPVPDTPLGEVPFDDWVDLWGQGIYQQLENQSDALDFIGSNGEDQIEELESIDSNLDDLNQTAESIDTNIGTGIGLLGGIKSGIETAVDFLEGIAEHVGELVEEIVEGTETLIAGILNQIPSVFGVIFGPIKQASSIWHYVVEWIQSISAPMSWIWSMSSGTSYNIILPVYASLAGAVVLAFYKRFGK